MKVGCVCGVGPHDAEGALSWAKLSIYNCKYLFKNQYAKTPTKQYYIFSVFYVGKYFQEAPPGIGCDQRDLI